MSPGATDCAQCGIVFAKYVVLQERRWASGARSPTGVGSSGRVDAWADGAQEASPLDPSGRAPVVARAVLWVALAAWTVAFARHTVASNYAGESVLHLVNLVFHEAGHVLFAPFGRVLTVAGGSLLQLLVPVACAVALWRARDRFGATVGAWWAGQSLLDLAPYIADARALRLVLLGGKTGAEVEGHDWEFLLATFGWLRHDLALGQAAHVAGLGLMAVALVAGAVVLVSQWPRRGQVGPSAA